MTGGGDYCEHCFRTDPAVAPTPEVMWDRFVAHLNATQPLTKEKLPHKSFCGSIAAYKRIFIEANKE
jgi:hypothetical protein